MATPNPPPLRVVSLNAWGGAMYDELAAWLPQADADLVCLQEVTRTPGLSGWTHFEDDERTLPQRADLMADVSEVLSDRDAWFTVSDTGPVRSRDGEVYRQDFGLAMFARATLERLAGREAHVHGEYADHSDRWPPSNRPRAAQVARFGDPGSKRTVTVGHMHGLRDATGKGDTPARRRQAEQLVGLIESIRQPEDLTVVCGDFNVLPHSETFAILGEIGLTDLVGDTDTRTTRYTKLSRHASYLLVSDPGAVSRFEVAATPEVSDHRALLVEF